MSQGKKIPAKEACLIKPRQVSKSYDLSCVRQKAIVKYRSGTRADAASKIIINTVVFRAYTMRPFTKALLPFFFILFVFSGSVYASGVNTPDYWIKDLESPDEVVLGPQAIETLNRTTIEKTEQMADLISMPDEFPDWVLFEWLLNDAPTYGVGHAKRFFPDGTRVSSEFLEGVSKNMNLEGVAPENRVAYGVVVERADLRAFPTSRPILRRPGRLEFDTVQYSSLFPGEPVALLHASRDGRWGFFQTSTVRGWMLMSKVAFGDKYTALYRPDDFLVVTGSSVRVYRDRNLKKALSEVTMGSLLSLAAPADNARYYAVKFPQRAPSGSLVWAEAYIDRNSDVNTGFLPYTRKNVITQAFKMLGEEYGWGGKDGKRDCSEFIKDLFSTMGIMLPRNSRSQGVSGEVLAYRNAAVTPGEITEALMNARPGMTLLGLDRHIMLYLGVRDGKPYAIHQIFGYKDGPAFKLLNRVVVTDLEIGRRSRSGPLKKRIRSVTEIRVPLELL